jgi:hypothetical protein
VSADQGQLGGLPQRLGPHRGERGLDGFGVPALVDEGLGERLQPVDPHLPQPLTLDDQPVFVPSGEQVGVEQVDQSPIPAGRRPLGDGGDPAPRVGQVDADERAEAHGAPRRVHEDPARLAQAPQRVAQCRRRAPLVGVGPETAGEHRSRLHPLHHREVREQPLCLQRQLDLPAVDKQVEHPHDPQPDRCSPLNIHKPPPRLGRSPLRRPANPDLS